MVDQEIRVLGDENIIANPKNSQKQYPLTFKAVPNVIVYGRKKADLNFTVPITEGTNFNFNLERTAIIFSDSFNLEEYSYIMVKNPFEEISDFFYVSSLEELDPTGKEFNEFNNEVVKWLRRLVNIISNRCMIFETTLFKDLNNFPNIKTGQTFIRTEDGWTGITIRDINSELDLIFNKYVEEINKNIQEHQIQMNELLEQWKQDIQKYAENVKQYEIIRVVTQTGHGFVFEPVMYSISQRKFVKAVFPHGADGVAVRVDDNNFRLVWAGRVEIPSTAKDTQQRDFVLGEYYFLGEGSNGGIQREKPDTYYQHLFQVMYSDELRQNIADVLLSVPINQKGKRWDVGEAKTTVNDIEELKMSDFPVGKVIEVLGYYKAGDGADHKRIISTSDDGSGVQLNNGLWANISEKEINTSTFGIKKDNIDLALLRKYVSYKADKFVPDTKITLKEIGGKWYSGLKYPVAFYGDSTTDGNNTTGWSPNPTNPVGSINHTETGGDNAYSKVLQDTIRDITGNNLAAVYNAGYSGQQMSNGWALNNIEKAIFSNTHYQDTEVVFIGFGLNDLAAIKDNKILMEKYFSELECVINYCLLKETQPILVKSTPSYQLNSRDTDRMVLYVETCIDTLAKRYNLEIVNLRQEISEWLSKNKNGDNWAKIISDTVHLNDKGHRMVASYLISLMFGNVYCTGEETERLISFENSEFSLNAIVKHNTNFKDTVRTGNIIYTLFTENALVGKIIIYNSKENKRLSYLSFSTSGVKGFPLTKDDYVRIVSKKILNKTQEENYPLTDGYRGVDGYGVVNVPNILYDLDFGLTILEVYFPKTKKIEAASVIGSFLVTNIENNHFNSNASTFFKKDFKLHILNGTGIDKIISDYNYNNKNSYSLNYNNKFRIGFEIKNKKNNVNDIGIIFSSNNCSKYPELDFSEGILFTATGTVRFFRTFGNEKYTFIGGEIQVSIPSTSFKFILEIEFVDNTNKQKITLYDMTTSKKIIEKTTKSQYFLCSGTGVGLWSNGYIVDADISLEIVPKDDLIALPL